MRSMEINQRKNICMCKNVQVLTISHRGGVGGEVTTILQHNLPLQTLSWKAATCIPRWQPTELASFRELGEVSIRDKGKWQETQSQATEIPILI